jgi:hypothetical protein
MKTIAQLLELSKNRFYKFIPEEQEALDDFLLNKSAQQNRQVKHSTGSSKQTPAIVKQKNIVRPEHGDIPLEEDREPETEAVEDIVHPDAVK